MLDTLQQLLESMATDPDAGFRAAAVSDGERGSCWLSGTIRATSIPGIDPAHQLFKAPAARAADEVAVTCEGHELGYGGLDSRGSRLAHPRLIAPRSQAGDAGGRVAESARQR